MMTSVLRLLGWLAVGVIVTIALPAGRLDARHLDHGYAVTGHRAQGATVDQTWIQTSDTLYREWGYVAAARGRHQSYLLLYVTADTVNSAGEVDHGAWQSTTATATQRLT